ncbi:hypothetical protein BASA81_006116 [Batrachochytrium salamandrivorans]|nr:hypothetical protein BASA81_006116 [Batrachochytrium salamandrivorans]
MGKAKTNQSPAAKKQQKKAVEEKPVVAVVEEEKPVVAAVDVAVVEEKKQEKKAKKQSKKDKTAAVAASTTTEEEKEEEAKPEEKEQEVKKSEEDMDDEELLALALKEDNGMPKLSKPEGEVAKPRKPQSKANVLYLGHIPEGFYENEMKKFLNQFGKLANVRVSRSTRTGKSRGYGFLQFFSPEVTAIVQKTLHGYILMGRSLVCQPVLEEHVYDKMFAGGLSAYTKHPHINTKVGARKRNIEAQIARVETPESIAKRVKRLQDVDAARQAKLLAKGIKYEYVAGYNV